LSGGSDLCYKGIVEKETEYMDLKHDEQKLLADFRSLTIEGKAELLDYAAFLQKKYSEQAPGEVTSAANQCTLDKQTEERPEAIKEPIFTE
jgi:hypothetical protein